MCIDQKITKLKTQVLPTLLNIFHLIYKVDLLSAEVPKLHSEDIDWVYKT
jgi:hypothetical protein